MGVLTSCKPRKEVLAGDLADEIFAADFGRLIAGSAPKVYGNAKAFVQNTHPAQQLCKVVQAVFGRLSDTKEAGATLRLSTGFGGGKTHTLMALWHLAKKVRDPSLGTELLPAAGRPDKVAVIAVDAGKAGVPEFAKHGSTQVHSLHGEIAFQMGGAKALKALGKADDPESSPNESQIAAAFPEGPVLVLLDELVIYMASLSERGQGNVLGYLNRLSAVVSNRPQTVLIVTDPARQVAYAPQAASLGASLEQAAAKLDDVFDRKVSDFDPIGGEGARVIVRRLFEKVDEAAAQATSAGYLQLYKRVTDENAGLIPASATSADYAKRILECYPFHPRLLQTAEQRLGAMQAFQKSRGVLRLFARIVRDVWDAQVDHELISAGEIDWSSSRIQADLLQRLNRDQFKAAVDADLSGHAAELDGGGERGVHSRVASALLLESLPLQSSSGLDPTEATLAVLRPDDAGPEPSEALERLAGACWHTYSMEGGRGSQFRYEPNVLKQIEERKGTIELEDAKGRVLTEVRGYFSGPSFKLAAWPASAKQVPESAVLQLALCESEARAKSVCACSDDTDPQAPQPRRFQNAIVAVAATQAALNEAVSSSQRLIAAEDINREHSRGDTGKLVREQLKRMLPELTKQFRLRSCRAFDKVALAGGAVFALDEQFQVPDEQVLQKAQGQRCLMRFLEEKSLIYGPDDALDVRRFLRDVLPGATPVTDSPDTYSAKAVHERFLSAPKLRLIRDGSIVRKTILRALGDGKLVVRTEDGRAYDANGCVAGEKGKRRRVEQRLTSFGLDDTVLVAAASSPTANEWLKEDTGTGGGGDTGKPPPPPPPTVPPGRTRATTWEQIVGYAQDRPLLELRLTARKPADVSALAQVVQPLGANSLSLSLSVGGALKAGGNANFMINDVGLNHPAKPLDMARTLFNSMETAADYEAQLRLDFGAEGRSGLAEQLRQVADSAPDEVRPEADFDKPVGGDR